MTDIDAFLEHHGVKGMRWGVSKATHPQFTRKQIHDYNKNMDLKESLKTASRTKAANPLDQLHFQRYIKGQALVEGTARGSKKKAYGLVAGGTALDAATVAAGYAVTTKYIATSPRTKAGAKIAFGVLAARAAVTRIDQLASIHTYSRQEERVSNYDLVTKALKEGSK